MATKPQKGAGNPLSPLLMSFDVACRVLRHVMFSVLQYPLLTRCFSTVFTNGLWNKWREPACEVLSGKWDLQTSKGRLLSTFYFIIWRKGLSFFKRLLFLSHLNTLEGNLHN